MIENVTHGNKDFSAISISGNDTLSLRRYYCNICNCNLVVLDYDKGELWCNRCHVSYFPEKQNVKRANKFTTPGPLTDSKGNIIGDKTPIVSMVDNNKGKEPSSIYTGPKLPPSFESRMKRPGVKLIDYTTSEY